MNDDLVTTTGILEWVKTQTEHKRPISPDLWMEIAQKLNTLKSDDNDTLIELEHQLAVRRANYVSEGGTSAAAKIMLEAEPVFKEVQHLKAKIKQIEEAIRLAKLSARIKSDEMRSGL